MSGDDCNDFHQKVSLLDATIQTLLSNCRYVSIRNAT
jgi:hypothetical protein